MVRNNKQEALAIPQWNKKSELEKKKGNQSQWLPVYSANTLMSYFPTLFSLLVNTGLGLLNFGKYI